RLMLARNQVDQVVRHLSLSGIDPLGDSSLRWQQVEVELQVARARNQPMLAMGMLETLALSIPSESPAIYIAEVDVMSQVSRERSAASIIEQQLASGLGARWLDLFLARSLELVEPGRMLQRVDALLAA